MGGSTKPQTKAALGTDEHGWTPIKQDEFAQVPSAWVVWRVGGVVGAGYQAASFDPVVAARREVGGHALTPLFEHCF